MKIRAALMVLMIPVAQIGSALAQQPCEALMSLKMADTTMMRAELVAKGDMELPNPMFSDPQATIKVSVPEFCRVAGSIKPTADSDIRFEVWMPASNWNGRFQQVGNGGLAGSVPVQQLARTLQGGWAVAGTDDGHVSTNVFSADWVKGHPEKVIDYGHRAVHLTALAAKNAVQAYYGEKPQYNYFTGCSDGGRESLMEAQRYPQDFDGYLVGAPGTDITGIGITYAHIARVMQALGNDQITANQLKAVSARVLERCDALDGVKDGLLDDPRRCSFKAKEMLCRNKRTDSCLSAAQAEALQQLYDGPKDQRGSALQPGFAGILGREKNLGAFPIQLAPMLAKNFVSELLYENPALDAATVNLAQATRDNQQQLAPIINPTADLRAARDAGKKIIVYNGWSDPNIPYQYSTNYYAAVQKTSGRSDDFLRMFMVPGWDHCGGDLTMGASTVRGETFTDPQHDVMSALQQWVEGGIAPDKLIATQYKSTGARQFVPEIAPGTPIERTRLLCPYPQSAKYKGKGDSNDARNYECKAR